MSKASNGSKATTVVTPSRTAIRAVIRAIRSYREAKARQDGMPVDASDKLYGEVGEAFDVARTELARAIRAAAGADEGRPAAFSHDGLLWVVIPHCGVEGAMTHDDYDVFVEVPMGSVAGL